MKFADKCVGGKLDALATPTVRLAQDGMRFYFDGPLRGSCFDRFLGTKSCPVRLAVRTPASHAGNRGSIPLPGTRSGRFHRNLPFFHILRRNPSNLDYPIHASPTAVHLPVSRQKWCKTWYELEKDLKMLLLR